MSERLTDGQRIVLLAAATGVRKGVMPGSLWRNFDQLEKRGLIQPHGMYMLYVATDTGREILKRIDT